MFDVPQLNRSLLQNRCVKFVVGIPAIQKLQGNSKTAGTNAAVGTGVRYSTAQTYFKK
jgi:hypothetical protein